MSEALDVASEEITRLSESLLGLKSEVASHWVDDLEKSLIRMAESLERHGSDLEAIQNLMQEAAQMLAFSCFKRKHCEDANCKYHSLARRLLYAAGEMKVKDE